MFLNMIGQMMMKIDLINDGPVTIYLEVKDGKVLVFGIYAPIAEKKDLLLSQSNIL